MVNRFELGYTPENLKQIIKESGLSQPAFAKKYGFKWTTFRRWLFPFDSEHHTDMPATKFHSLLQELEP